MVESADGCLENPLRLAKATPLNKSARTASPITGKESALRRLPLVVLEQPAESSGE